MKSGPDFAEQTAQCDNSESSKSCADMKLPQHLSDLFECSSKRLNHHEKEQLRLLLIKHSDVFAKSADDLGHTYVVKHRIDTGDNPPVKQRPRRPPFAFAQEE